MEKHPEDLDNFNHHSCCCKSKKECHSDCTPRNAKWDGLWIILFAAGLIGAAWIIYRDFK